MATPLDNVSGVLGAIIPFFIAIFVWVITYAFLDKTKAIGTNKNRNAMIALVAAILVVALPDVTRLIVLIVPWFFFLFLFLMLVAIGFLFVSGGTDMGDMYKALGGSSTTWLFVVIGGIILAFAAASVYGQSLLTITDDGNTTNGDLTGIGDQPTDSDSFRGNLAATLFDPAILGLAVFFLIATFAIIFLTQESAPH